jgi:hypothetical protein
MSMGSGEVKIRDLCGAGWFAQTGKHTSAVHAHGTASALHKEQGRALRKAKKLQTPF